MVTRGGKSRPDNSAEVFLYSETEIIIVSGINALNYVEKIIGVEARAKAACALRGNQTMQKYVLSILVQNRSGVLRRVANLFSRRGYNIESLTVGQTQDADYSRMTAVVADCDDVIVDQITKQVSKLIEVVRVEILNPETSVFREMQLIKVKTTKDTRAEILEIVEIFRARVIDVSRDSLILEATGDTKKLCALTKMLEPFTILEIVRTGLSAIERGAVKFRDGKD